MADSFAALKHRFTARPTHTTSRCGLPQRLVIRIVAPFLLAAALATPVHQAVASAQAEALAAAAAYSQSGQGQQAQRSRGRLGNGGRVRL